MCNKVNTIERNTFNIGLTFKLRVDSPQTSEFDVVTHDLKMSLDGIFNSLAMISKEYENRHYFSFKITSLAVLSRLDLGHI